MGETSRKEIEVRKKLPPICNQPPRIILQEVEEKSQLTLSQLADAQPSSSQSGTPPEEVERRSKRWEEQLNELEFIDEDEELVVTSEKEKQRLRARSLSYDWPWASDATNKNEAAAFRGQTAQHSVSEKLILLFVIRTL
ncbi:MAG: hypothetical protein GY696_33895 [Gammaproteobacteria bacterium]|nr:hypothetical protein [Gammaproteobacteria bacterium]